MEKLRVLRCLFLIGMAMAFPAGRAMMTTNLVFDAISKQYNAAVGEMTAEFDFSVTNTATTNITVRSVRASCGCTTPKLPSLPWELAGGTNGSFHVTVDLRGKAGTFQKTIFMDTTEGPKMLYVNVSLPDAGSVTPGAAARTHNMQIALQDRQSIFKNDCATCHKPEPTLTGEKLFAATCGICHEADHRATSVPDLHALKAPATEAYWEAWIRYGKAGTMMPAFAHENDGPLSNEQITSLVGFLVKDFPNRKVKTTAAVPAPVPTGGTFAAPRRTAIPPLPTSNQSGTPPTPVPGT